MKEIYRKTVEFLDGRKKAYKLAFSGPAGIAVLIDLASFCRASESCFHDDPRKHALLEGRREVWLRIQQHLKLDSEQLFKLYNGQDINLEDDE